MKKILFVLALLACGNPPHTQAPAEAPADPSVAPAADPGVSQPPADPPPAAPPQGIYIPDYVLNFPGNDTCDAAFSDGQIRALPCFCQQVAANAPFVSVDGTQIVCAYNPDFLEGRCDTTDRGIMMGRTTASCTRIAAGQAVSCTMPVKLCVQPG